MIEKLFLTRSIPGYFLVRLIMGYVFLVAGLQKFIFSETMGPGRFAEMGYANPAFTAYLVAFFEVVCAILILLGLASRLAAIPLSVIMVVAIVTTKIPRLPDGFWPFAHALRLDLAMLLLALFVLINGSGGFSLDRRIGSGLASRGS